MIMIEINIERILTGLGTLVFFMVFPFIWWWIILDKISPPKNYKEQEIVMCKECSELLLDKIREMERRISTLEKRQEFLKETIIQLTLKRVHPHDNITIPWPDEE